MYILYLTMKTPNGLFSLAILLYSILLATLCPKLRCKDKYAIVVILCILPALAAIVHFVINGKITFWAYKFLYLESAVPLILTIPGKKKALLSIKSIVSVLTTFLVCSYFIVLSTSSPLIHNYTRYNYTDSFKKMMATLKKEYCLNSWKKIDYDSLLEEYLPKVEEAEKNNDEVAFAAIVNEVTYRFYDSHVYTEMTSVDLDIKTREYLAGKGGENVEITFIDDDGKEQHARLKKLGTYNKRLVCSLISLLHTNTDYPNYYYKMIDDKCGYLYIDNEEFDMISDNVAVARKGYYPKLVDYYAGIIKNIKAQGMEYLIVDIRNNCGGYDNVAGALTSLFTEEKRDMFSLGYEDEAGYHVTESQYIFPDGRYKDLPVAVLVNANCVSAGDGMAKYLGECPNVTLMGITASGGVN